MIRLGIPRAVLAVVLASTLAGCVKRSTYDAALAELNRQHSEQEGALRTELAQRDGRITQLEGELRAGNERIAQLEAELERRNREISGLDRELMTSRSQVAQLETLLNQRGEQYTQLQERVLALSQVEREIRERNRIYEEVLQQFRSLIDAGRLTVEIVRGRMVIQLPQDILFQSGSATLSADGRRTLMEVGQVLATLNDRDFQVEGHTDNVPISTERFPSNWELSSARAMSVIRVLLDAGVSPERLSGAGYGEYQPVAPNDTPENRRLNRRIEIVMLPNLDVIATTQLPQ